MSSLSLGYTVTLLMDAEEQEAMVASLGDVGEMAAEEDEAADEGDWAVCRGAAAGLWKGESLVESSLLYAPLRLRLKAEQGDNHFFGRTSVKYPCYNIVW